MYGVPLGLVSFVCTADVNVQNTSLDKRSEFRSLIFKVGTSFDLKYRRNIILNVTSDSSNVKVPINTNGKEEEIN